MKLQRQARRVAFAGTLLLAAAATAAASAPQARPRAFDPELLRTGDIIRYRDLRRTDFRAALPPPEAAGLHGGELGAASCVFLATDPDTTIRASAQGDDQYRGLVRAEVENLAFLSFMDRQCSWWNPAPLSLPADYILQHEQIHFALFEIAARRLNSRVAELTRQMRVVTNSQQRAIEELNRRIDAEMQRALDEVLARSNELDNDTSRTYRQDRQNWWWDTVNRELDRLADADHP
ncbi:MAG: hypothetical protein PVJ49_11785 [Acidobacteriota bacterium]|jgi:hypothetical protein